MFHKRVATKDALKEKPIGRFVAIFFTSIVAAYNQQLINPCFINSKFF